jgi:hypothetical protein
MVAVSEPEHVIWYRSLGLSTIEHWKSVKSRLILQDSSPYMYSFIVFDVLHTTCLLVDYLRVKNDWM